MNLNKRQTFNSTLFVSQSTALVVLQLILFALFGWAGQTRTLAASYSLISSTVTILGIGVLYLVHLRVPQYLPHLFSVIVSLFATIPFVALASGEAVSFALPLYLLGVYAVPLLIDVCSRTMHIAMSIGIVVLVVLAQQYNPLLSGESIPMIAAAAAIATLMRWRLAPHKTSGVAEASTKDYFETQAMSRAWQCLFLQGSVLLLLLFTDVVRSSTASVPVQLKLLGLASLIVSAYLMIGIRRESVELRMTVSTLLVGTVVSLSTLWDDGQYSLYAALPTLYILGLTSVFHWAVHRYLFIVGWLVCTDVALRFGLPLTGYNRAAIVSVCLGGVVAIIVSRARHAILMEGQVLVNEPEESSRVNTYPISEAIRNRLHGLQLQRVAYWQRFYAGAAVLLCSYLVSVNAAPYYWLVLIGVVILLVLHAAVQHLIANEKHLALAWMLTFCSFAIAALWSGVPILHFAASNVFYLFWAVTISLGIAICPWRFHELITIGLIACIMLIESIGSLGVSSDKIYAAFVLLSVSLVISRSLEYSLRESLLVSIGFDSLQSAESVEVCERRLVEVILLYIGAQSAFFRTSLGSFGNISDRTHSHSPDELIEFFDCLDAANVLCESDSRNYKYSSFSLSSLASKNSSLSFPKRFQENALYLQVNFDGAETPYQADFLFVRPLPFYGITRVLFSALVVLDLAKVQMQYLMDRLLTAQVRDKITMRDALREYELSAMVHDINNTVQDLTLLCGSIREELADCRDSASFEGETIHSDIELIEATARSIAHVVSDAKRRRELEQLDDLAPREVVDIEEVVSDVIVFATLRAERKGISVSVVSELNESSIVRVSVREHLDAVLRNLLQNAVAYSSNGSQILVKYGSNDDSVYIRISDSGVGLTDEELEQVFEPGYRGRLRDTSHGGLGLGLAQSRRVIEAAGGKLSGCSNGPGLGATFSVELPKAPDTDYQDEGPWALLVDDEPRLIMYYERLISACDLKPVSASNFGEVKQILDVSGPPTIVITDLHLGVDRGEQVIEEIRTRFGQSIPILVITGIRDSARTDKARQAGATEVIHKPIGQHALYARIESSIPGDRDGSRPRLSKDSSKEL